MVDTMIFDTLGTDAEALKVVKKLVATERLELLVTVVQEAQLSAIPEQKSDLRERILAIPRRLVPRTSAILGEAVLGAMRLGTTGRIDSNEGEADNSIAGEAKAHGVPLVTEDRVLTRRATEAGVEVLSWADFRETLAID
jgi:predicted nucleic acid-binding protein